MTISCAAYTDIVEVLETSNLDIFSPTDISILIRSEVGDLLKKTASEVVPHVNVADDPYNNNVIGSSVSSELVDLLRDEVSTQIHSSERLEPMKQVVKNAIRDMHALIDEAILHRSEILATMQRNRIEDELKSMIIQLKLNNTILRKENGEFRDDAKDIIENVKVSIANNNVRKVLSYKVVEIELKRAIDGHNLDVMDTRNAMWDSLEPFLREGIRDHDKDLVKQNENAYAKDMLLEKLKIQSRIVLLNGLIQAKKMSDIMFEDEKGSVTFTRDIVEDFSINNHKAFSICFSNNDYLLHREFIEKNRNTNMTDEEKREFGLCTSKACKRLNFSRRGTRSMRRLYTEKLNSSMHIGSDLRYLLYNIVPIEKKIRQIEEQVKTNFDKDFEAYLAMHRSYDDEKSAKMTELVKALVESSYKNIQTTDYELLLVKNFFFENSQGHPDISEITNSTHLNTLASFQKDIENISEDSIGFLRGSFVYSKPYYILLKNLHLSTTPDYIKEEL